MTLKILGGEWGGRILKSPKGDQTRPTTSLLRKAVFDILQPRIQGAIFLDLFAGSGAMGIEALSRGAERAIFVDQHREAIQCLKENLALFKIENRSTVLQSDAMKALSRLEQMQATCDVIYADPPYDRAQLYLELLKAMDASPLLKLQGLLFLESPVPSPLKDLAFPLKRLRLMQSRRYGASELYQYITAS